MRGWWSARPKAKVWDSGAARAYESRADAPAEVASSASARPRPTGVFPPLDPAGMGPAPVERLFDGAPGDAARRNAPFAYAPPAVASTIPLPKSFAATVARPSESAPDPASATTASTTPFPTTPFPTTASAPALAPAVDTQGEFLRLLEVVTSMCDHVIEYIEADRAERQVMIEMLSQLGRAISDGATTVVSALAAQSSMARVLEPHGPPAPSEPWAFAQPASKAAEPAERRERVIGGSVAAGDELIDLTGDEALAHPVAGTEVEARGRFGERWVGGLEICEVMTTPDGPRYRLRRRLDGEVLPELFEGSGIRAAEPAATAADPAADESARAAASRERSMESHPSSSDPRPGGGANGSESGPANGVNGSAGYWSRS